MRHETKFYERPDARGAQTVIDLIDVREVIERFPLRVFDTDPLRRERSRGIGHIRFLWFLSSCADRAGNCPVTPGQRGPTRTSAPRNAGTDDPAHWLESEFPGSAELGQQHTAQCQGRLRIKVRIFNVIPTCAWNFSTREPTQPDGCLIDHGKPLYEICATPHETYDSIRASVLIAIITLGLGIGATTAVFSVVDHVLVRPLPYAQPDRLISISTLLFQMEFVASLEYVEWRRSNHVLEQLAAWPHSSRTGSLTIGDEPVKIDLTRISDNFFDTLGVHPMLGRGFLPDETRPGGPNVIILSHGLWIRGFGSDPGVIGRSVIFEGSPCTIVGVLPPNFQFPDPGPIEALTPLPIPTSADRRSMAAWNTMAG